MDSHRRAVLAWRLSNTMDAEFCVADLEEAMNRYGVPEIFNADQGSQFTSLEFIQALKDANVAISMGGKGRWMDNVMIERPWRSVKWECLYLREVETGSQARKILRDRFQFYNEQFPHTALTAVGQLKYVVKESDLKGGKRQTGLEINNVANLSN